MKSISVILKEIGDLIIAIDEREKAYAKLVEEGNDRIDDMNMEETENHGVFVGKQEILAEMKLTLLKIIKE